MNIHGDVISLDKEIVDMLPKNIHFSVNTRRFPSDPSARMYLDLGHQQICLDFGLF
jgi:hypothetical protein